MYLDYKNPDEHYMAAKSDCWDFYSPVMLALQSHILSETSQLLGKELTWLNSELLEGCFFSWCKRNQKHSPWLAWLEASNVIHAFTIEDMIGSSLITGKCLMWGRLQKSYINWINLMVEFIFLCNYAFVCMCSFS